MDVPEHLSLYRQLYLESGTVGTLCNLSTDTLVPVHGRGHISTYKFITLYMGRNLNFNSEA